MIGLTANDFVIERISRRNKNLISRISQYKIDYKHEDLTRSLDKGLNLEKSEQRKTSLPANLKLETIKENKWLKEVKKWTKKPEGTVEIEKVQKLKKWLMDLGLSQDIDDLMTWFDWENNRPKNSNESNKGLHVDPYNPLRGESYFIQVSKQCSSSFQILFSTYLHTRAMRIILRVKMHYVRIVILLDQILRILKSLFRKR